MYLFNYFGFDISSIFLAAVLNTPVGYVDGNYQPHVCNRFASAAEHVTTEIKNQNYSLPDFISSLDNTQMSKEKREQIDEAIQWVYSNQIENPIVAKQTALAVCLGEKNNVDDPMNNVKWSGPF